MTERTIVYEAINSERKYQDQKWGNHKHTLTEWLVYINDYADEALHMLSRNDDKIAHDIALSNIRKITAMGVACMEEHGIPEPRKVL